MLIFYPSVIYLPTTGSTEQYKSFSQVTFHSNVMLQCVIYIPLLLRMANDVEGNTDPQYMMLLNHYVLILAMGIQKILDKLLVNNV